MQKYSKHITEFPTKVAHQIIIWGREKLKLSASVLEAETTKIMYEQGEGNGYLVGANVNGVIVKAKIN